MSELLSFEQKMAVCHVNGPALVIAGPGSGKTFTLTKRLEYLIKQVSIEPCRIIVITFTRLAANEMKKRFIKLIGVEQNLQEEIRFGTFHSFFYAQLKNLYYYRDVMVINENEAFQFIKSYILNYLSEKSEQNGPSYAQVIHKRYEKRSEELTDSFFTGYAKIRNESKDLNDYTNQEIFALFMCQRDLVESIWFAYENYKRRHSVIDFEDMQSLFLSELKHNPLFLTSLRKQFHYYLIDEFQDINPIQYEIIKLLVYPLNNLFVVGDEDQSIYAFRGSSPRFFLHFKEDYPGAKMIHLTTNYRSYKNIVDATSLMIRNNQERFKKDLVAFHSQKTRKPVFYHIKNEDDEKKLLSDTLLYYRQKGLSLSNMAVLFRTHQQAERYTGYLSQNLIPFEYECEKVYPNSKLADTYWLFNEILYANNYERIEALLDFFQLRTSIKEQILHEVQYGTKIREVLEKTDTDCSELSFFIKNFCKRTPRENLLLLIIAYPKRSGFIDLCLKRGGVKYLKLFVISLWKAKCYEEVKTNLKKNLKSQYEDVLNVLTMHSAKGLEFDLVYIPGVTKEFVPHPSNPDLEEERRLLYVAMTRAKKYLFLSESMESQFKNELMVALKNVYKTF